MLKDDSVPTGVKDAIKITKAIVVVGLNPTIARYGEALPIIVGTIFCNIKFILYSGGKLRNTISLAKFRLETRCWISAKTCAGFTMSMLQTT